MVLIMCLSRNVNDIFLLVLWIENWLFVNAVGIRHVDFQEVTQYRLFRPVHSDLLSTDGKTHFIKLDLINKDIDAVNLSSILRSKSVTETVPTYFKEKEPLIISYTYTKTIASKIFNFSSTLSNLDCHQSHNNPSQCECNISSHLYQPYGHVVTCGLSIILNSKLKDLIAKGLKYREPCKVDWDKNLSTFV